MFKITLPYNANTSGTAYSLAEQNAQDKMVHESFNPFAFRIVSITFKIF